MLPRFMKKVDHEELARGSRVIEARPNRGICQRIRVNLGALALHVAPKSGRIPPRLVRATLKSLATPRHGSTRSVPDCCGRS
jgi:hypothetical protein